MSNAERLLAALVPIFGSDDDVTFDHELIDAWIERLRPLAAPRFTALMTAQGGVDREFVGVDELRDGWQDWLDAFASMRLVLEEVQEVDANVVLMARQVATTRHGVEVEQPSAAVWKFDREGRLRRVEFHLDREMALASARD